MTKKRLKKFHFSFYQTIIKPILFNFDAEKTHHFIISISAFIFRFSIFRLIIKMIYSVPRKQFSVTEPYPLGSLRLINPIGLAAGFDKNAELIAGLECLGFGFIEIGTVTPKPQQGNPKPRLFRVPEKKALLNRMGFNNEGADIIAQRLRETKKKIQIPVGVNLGKNKDTPNNSALDDYAILFQKFSNLADYFTINLSSPNTPGLLELQNTSFILELNKKIHELTIPQPVFLKLSPSLDINEIKEICSLFNNPQFKPQGLILTNTIPTDLGGISGLPLKNLSLKILKTTRALLPKHSSIISVGGIEDASDVRERLANGAAAVQIYTSLVYNGPSVVRSILKDIL